MKRLHRMQRRLAIFSVVIPISSTLKRLCDGRINLLKGRTSRARQSFRKGLQLAERFDMPYFAAMLNFELAQITESETESHQLTVSAQDEFRRLGVSERPASP